MKISNNDLSNVLKILNIDIENIEFKYFKSLISMSNIFEVLWRKYINHNPNNENWINRDRFILSNDNNYILLYITLHLLGYKISIEDLKKSKLKNTTLKLDYIKKNKNLNVKIITEHLGDSLANAIGLAIGEKIFSNTFNLNNINLINHKTYIFVNDECLIDGTSHELCLLASILNLNKLIILYNNNSNENIKNLFSENIKKRFISYNWNVISNINIYNRNEIIKAIRKTMISNKPSIIMFKTITEFKFINKYNDFTNNFLLKKNEILNIKYNLQWKFDKFFIPKDIYKKWCAKKIGFLKEKKWNIKLNIYKKLFPKLFYELNRRVNLKLPKIFEKEILNYLNNLKNNNNLISTKKSSQKIINKISDILPELIECSSDPINNNLITYNKFTLIKNNFKNNYINIGIKKSNISSILNGISCYNGLIPYNETFLNFMDYSKNSLRIASLMNIKNIFLYIYDSIKQENNFIYQPIEFLNDLRIIPNLITWRPCDEIETLFAWKNAIYRKGPTVIILSRQNFNNLKRNKNSINNINKGGYILYDSKKNNNKITIISTGSEIKLSINIKKYLDNIGYFTRIVSMPSTNIFDMQNEKYKNKIVFNKSFKVIIEASHTDYWNKYINNKENGIIFGIKTFKKLDNKINQFNYLKLNKYKIINKILEKIKL